MTRFYTKKGDDGYTSLLGEGRAPKYDRRIETVGVIDEANAAIALARTLSISSETSRILLEVQRDLYHMMSEVAASPENASRFRVINIERVSWLEARIDEISSNLSSLVIRRRALPSTLHALLLGEPNGILPVCCT
jgi:cob(I)alamin adenosyltransferase